MRTFTNSKGDFCDSYPRFSMYPRLGWWANLPNVKTTKMIAEKKISREFSVKHQVNPMKVKQNRCGSPISEVFQVFQAVAASCAGALVTAQKWTFCEEALKVPMQDPSAHPGGWSAHHNLGNHRFLSSCLVWTIYLLGYQILTLTYIWIWLYIYTYTCIHVYRFYGYVIGNMNKSSE